MQDGLLAASTPGQAVTAGDARTLVTQGLGALSLENKRVLVIIPDGTRTMPMPMMVDAIESAIGMRAAAVDFLVALGTHTAMTDAQLTALIGREVVNGVAGTHRVMNHRWDLPETFATLGNIPAAEVSELTHGLIARDVSVALNRAVFDYDHLVICGPVFPHEVVGFSGGNKYLFPGIAGPDIINFTHWLGALLGSFHVIGTGTTPVRAVIDRAARLLDRPLTCISLVVTADKVHGLFIGSAESAWRAASALSSRTHIIYVERPYQRVLCVMPRMYADVWTAGKGMYKLEPAVADGGEVIIYAPHITEVSYTHGKQIDEIGYHCRDYFLKQWDRFGHYPGGVLAHSTHVKGLGTYDAATGVETPRISVTLATGIPEARCRRINLGYLDPATINVDDWKGREREGVLVVPHAGEMLYRLKA
jgi:nickel-dependent lactate racemase